MKEEWLLVIFELFNFIWSCKYLVDFVAVHSGKILDSWIFAIAGIWYSTKSEEIDPNKFISYEFDGYFEWWFVW